METTINIHYDILDKISFIARTKGISRSEMIIMLIKKGMIEMADPGRLGNLVRYQERARCGDWHVFHIKLRVDDYEYLLDLRKFLKMSVSLILASMVKKYLSGIFKKNITDNYRFKDYIIIKEVLDNVICWKFLWGFPPNIKKFLPA